MTLDKLLSPELYAQVQARIDEVNSGQPDKTKHVRFADLSEGGYVSAEKHNSKVSTLTQQVTDLQTQIAQRDTDMAGLQTQLAAAQADTGKLADAQQTLATLQTKYDTDKQSWEQKIQQQQYEYMVRERANALRFSSAAAKRDFIREANGKGFKVDGDTLLGYEDFVTKYKADNPGAVVEAQSDPEPAKKPPTIVLPNGQPKTPPDKSVFGFHFNGVRPKPQEE